ncbi:MAG: class I SAM-dependent methyltransferase [Candidatus Caldipriscus sp.]
MNRITLKGRISDYGQHPWIFRDKIKSVENQGVSAEVYVNGKFLGCAFYNPEGKLALRFYSREKEEFNAGLVYRRIMESVNFRENVLKLKGSYRLFFAESDNMPGIIADFYGKGVVIQISSYGAEKLKREIVEGFRMAGYEFLYEKSDSYARRQENLEPFEGFHFGNVKNLVVEIDGIKMIFPIGGQKTGLYLDQRLNWKIVSSLMENRERVLDAFSYTGGFTLNLLARGVKRVFAVDEDEGALSILKENLKLNGFKGAETIVGNVFDILDTFILSNDSFDGIKMIFPIGGQKTGLYLDQRVNWKIVSSLMENRERVLDAFSYTGGFTLHLLARGVKRVLAVDEDEEALSILKENLKLNGFKGAETIVGNVFDILDTFILSNDSFDGIILDPPAFAKSKDISGAMKGYTRLFDRALRLIRKGGIFVVFSCSHHIDYSHLEEVLSKTAKRLFREVKILYRLYQSPDHPVPVYFKEAEYLRGLACLVY